MFRLGIDLGGTKIEGVVLEETGKEVLRKRIATEREKGYEHILDNLVSLYQTLCHPIHHAPHTLGLGTPGALSPRTGRLKNSNTLCMNDRPIQMDLEARLGRPLAIQNDANCFAMAEALLGAGRGKNLVFGVIMGTGCGGGIVYKGEVITGPQAIAGEWGHMCIDPEGPLCYCQQKGCVETFISGGGLQRRWEEQYGESKKFEELVALYYAGEPRAVAFMEVFFDRYGRAIANLINILDPDVVVIGGGVSNFDALYTEGLAKVKDYIFTDVLETPIVKHHLGDSAGVIGAALIGI